MYIAEDHTGYGEMERANPIERDDGDHGSLVG
jgi:hypothetical protein